MEQPLNGVDDLFGDPGGLDIPLDPSSAVPNMLSTSFTRKGLAERIDALKSSGCTRKIAWSKQGILAYVSKDGLRVLIRYLQCNKADGQWRLSDEMRVLPVQETIGRPVGRPIVHISFSETGFDLLLIDSSGGFHIFYSNSVIMNVWSRTVVVPPDADSDTAQPVGFAWLSLNRDIMAYEKAKMHDGHWIYPAHRQSPAGILQYNARPAAFLCITSLGYLKLLFQQPDLRWDKVTRELVKITYTDGILSHACVAPAEGNGVLIVTFSTQGKVNIFRVHIKFLPAPAPADQPPNPATQRPTPLAQPQIQMTHVKSHFISNIFHPLVPSAEEGKPPLQPNVAYNITHFHLLSTLSEGKFGDACLLAIFSAAQHDGPLGDRKPCVLTRWKLVTETETLHSSFDDVVHREAEAPPQPMMNLRRQEDIYFDHHVIDLHRDAAANVLTLVFDDGTITSYDLSTFSPVAEIGDSSTVTGLNNAGFYFPPVSSAMHCAFSTTGCLAATLDAESDVQLVYMKHDLLEGEEEPQDKEGLSRIVAALALEYARNCGSSHLSDDLIALARKIFKHQSTRLLFIREVYRAMPIIVDINDEKHNQFLSNQFVPKCLGLQAAIGFKSLYEVREPSAIVGWIALNIRQVTIIFSYIFRWFKKGNNAEFYDAFWRDDGELIVDAFPAILPLVFGNVKLTVDLFKFIMNELFFMSDTLLALKGDEKAMKEKAMTRRCLHYMSISVQKFAPGFNNAEGLSIESFQICDKTSALANDSSLPLKTVEDLLAKIEGFLKVSFTTRAANLKSEHEININGTVPPDAYPLVIRILTEIIPKVYPQDMKELDRISLAQKDYAWLGIADDKRTSEYKRTHMIDILRREIFDLPRPALQPIRRCTRCCEISTEAAGPRSHAASQVWRQLQIFKNCTCGGMYVLEKAETSVAKESSR
ncbi:hypothetical protein KEM56_000899 [Ascosphaera pollenicola]|nr:hypothetical protein KEM56_000899 [Ascosphaera pollenicola]